MNLETLNLFNWQNEPAEINFCSNGLIITAANNTGFRNDEDLEVYQDNGHFFHTKVYNQAELVVCWQKISSTPHGELGIMLQIDKYNWSKFSITEKDISCCNCCFGIEDYSFDYDIQPKYLKMSYNKNEIIFSHSNDNINYTISRKFKIAQDIPFLNLGIYISNQNSNQTFSALLEDVSLK